MRVQSPAVSIVLPARNAQRTLDEALTSLVTQTFTDFELLVIDDGSSDDTPSLLQRWAVREPRLRVITTPGLGIVRALNLGAEAAQAPLIARMDADDISLPRRLELSVAALDRHSDWSGVGTAVEIFRNDRPVSPNLQAYGRWLSSLTSPELVFRERFIESPLCHPSMLLRATALHDVGLWRDGPFPEDWELWLRLLERGHRLSCLPEVLLRWRDHDSRLTRQDARYALERHLDLKATYLSRVLGSQRLVLWGATDVGRGLSKRLSATGVTIVAFVELNPRKLGQKIHGVPVVAPDKLASLLPAHVLSCVAAKGARAEIRAWFAQHGLVEERDFTVVA